MATSAQMSGRSSFADGTGVTHTGILKRLQRYGYLLRQRDYYGRLRYRLSGRGARWLSKNRDKW